MATSPGRGPPNGDNHFSFFKGRLDAAGERVYCDGDWSMVYGAIDFLREREDSEQPLCLFLPLGYPHPPYCVEEPWYSLADRSSVPPRHVYETWDDKPALLAGIRDGQGLTGWTEERWRELRATYYGMCARVDHQLGLLIDALRDAGLYDDTALFVFSDHGDFTGDYGLVEKTQNTFQDALSRVPFVVKPPSGSTAPGIREQMVELVDFPATVYDMADIDCGYWHFGRSLANVLADPSADHRDASLLRGRTPRRRGTSQRTRKRLFRIIPRPLLTKGEPSGARKTAPSSTPRPPCAATAATSTSAAPTKPTSFTTSPATPAKLATSSPIPNTPPNSPAYATACSRGTWKPPTWLPLAPDQRNFAR